MFSPTDETRNVFPAAVRAAADGDNKENLIQKGSNLSLENWSHIVKTSLRSCRCGAAAGEGGGGGGGGEASSEQP